MAGDKSPLFYLRILITKEQITSLANEHLKDTPLFLTGVRIGSANQVSVFIDGDRGVTIDDCVALSRFIEQRLDREKEDFSLDVSSHGAAQPLIFPRQYRKHIGREFEISLNDGSRAEGTLVSSNDDEVVLERSVREPKPLGKGKITVTKQQTIKYNQIKESKIKLKF